MYKKYIFLLILCLHILLFSKSIAGDIPSPDSWFTIQLSFDESSLPDGVEIVYDSHPEYEPYAIKNSGYEPFYLVTKNLWKEAYPNSELPPDLTPLYKLQSSKVYFYGQTIPSDTLRWKENSGGINNLAASQVGINENLLSKNGIEIKNKYGDNRPQNVELPSPQDFKLSGYFNGSLVEIEGILSYKLNDKYNQLARAERLEEYNEISYPILPIIIFLAVIITLVFIFYKYKNVRIFLKPTKKKVFISSLLFMVVFVLPIAIAFFTKNPIWLLPLSPAFGLALFIKYALSYRIQDVMYSLIPFNPEILAIFIAVILSYLLSCLIMSIIQKHYKE